MNTSTLKVNPSLVYIAALSRYVENFAVPFSISEKINTYVMEAEALLASQKKSENNPFLKSIFSVVLDNDKDQFHSAVPLQLSGSKLFPVEASKAESEDCMDLLRKALSQIETTDPQRYGENMLFLLQTFMVNLPEPTHRYPGVSFYDYAKLLAAVATCLCNDMEGESPFLLVRADVSGIQNYILNIASKHAAKNLKGRSFYVRLLSDTIMYKMLWELELFQCHILYASGGNFMLLMPAEKKEALDQLLAKISQRLFEEYKTSISLVFGDVFVSRDELKDAPLKRKIDELFRQLDIKKKQKFAQGITQYFDRFFSPDQVEDAGGSIRRDAVTGEEFAWNEKVYWDDQGAWKSINAAGIDGVPVPTSNGEGLLSDKDFFNKISKKQIELGKQLKETKYWIISKERWKDAREEERYAPAKLGVYHYLISEDRKPKCQLFLQTNPSIVFQFNNPNYYKEDYSFGMDNIHGFTFYGGNAVPTFEMKFREPREDKPKEDIDYDIGDQKTFNHLAFKLKAVEEGESPAEKVSRFSRLGILRMDVDGLGWLFSEGLTASNYQHYNLLTYTALSRNLDTFFMGFLNIIWENGEWKSAFMGDSAVGEKLRHTSQIIYSGGDDLFIVGRWDACIFFAKEISHAFKQFTAQNNDKEVHPKLSISGGLAMVTHKFPIIKGADFAGIAEKEAKNYEIGLHKKNAFVLWKPLHWQWEMEKVEALKNEVAKYMSKGKKSEYKSVFQRILNFYELKEQLLRQEATQKHRWIWLLVYNISRTIEQYKKDSAFCDFLSQINRDIFSNSYQGSKDSMQGNQYFFDLLQVAIRWAELEYRTFHK